MAAPTLLAALRILLRRRHATDPATRLATRALIRTTLARLAVCRFPGA